MKPNSKKHFARALLLAAFSFQCSTFAQSYSIDWSTIDGGGGTSTGGVYSVSGTIGQPDAGKMSGGNYTVDGGFWGIVAAVQTPGAPLLSVSRSNNVVTVQWQQVAGWNLIQNTNVATPVASWSASSAPIASNGTNYLNLTNPAGKLYFRLKNP
ncbi:MAG: hypothetical protein RLZZ350_2545 [Verrucomicrobiota bacterium]|jgi:hypothetical protein